MFITFLFLALLRLSKLPTSLAGSGESLNCISWSSRLEADARHAGTCPASQILVLGSTGSVILPKGLPISGANLLDTGKVDFQWVIRGEKEGSQNTGGVSSKALFDMALFHACRVLVLRAGRSALQLIQEDRSSVPIRSKDNPISFVVLANGLASSEIGVLLARVARIFAARVPRASTPSKVM